MFGKRLTELRKQNNYTQNQIANILNIAPTTYSSYERGKRMPSEDIQNQIADFFNVSLDYLHGRSIEKQNHSGDLKEFIDGNHSTVTYNGKQLTKEDSSKLEIALTQIFWEELYNKKDD